jgi:hypothetical protein
MLAEGANLVTIPLIEEDVTVRAKIFVCYDPWPTNR